MELSPESSGNLRQTTMLQSLPGACTRGWRTRRVSGSQEPHELHIPGLLGEFDHGKRDRQLKATRPRAARIQIEDSGIVALLGLMRVAADDRVEAGGLRFKVKILQLVEHIQMETGDFDNCGWRKFLRPGLRVHVAADGKHRRDKFELRENFRRAHISRVNDELDAVQCALRFRAQKAVSIGDDADPHGGPKSD